MVHGNGVPLTTTPQVVLLFCLKAIVSLKAICCKDSAAINKLLKSLL